MKYIFNSAVITAPGIYSYRHITLEECRTWIETANPIPLSCVPYEETAKAFEILTGFRLPLNRISVEMQVGDEALVFRLHPPRIPDEQKGKLGFDYVLRNCEIGVLRRIR